jgi:hypothetical protein
MRVRWNPRCQVGAVQTELVEALSRENTVIMDYADQCVIMRDQCVIMQGKLYVVTRLG